MDVGNFVFGSSAFSKSSSNIWKFSVQVLLKPSLENFEHYFASLWDECNCVVVEIFLALSSFEIGMKKWAFPVLKYDAVKVLHSICQQIWKTQQWPWDWKRSVFIPIAKKGNAKECSNYCTIALISHASKVMLKILQARLQQYMNFELPDVQAGFRKDRGIRDEIANIHWIIEKAR